MHGAAFNRAPIGATRNRHNQKTMTHHTDMQDRLLLSTLSNVTFDGWTQKALWQAAEANDMTHAEANQVFPGGIKEVLSYFSTWTTAQMLKAAESESLSSLKVRDRITRLIRLRLEILEPYKEAVRSAAGLAFGPRSGLRATKQLWKVCDSIWYAAGDKATDHNYYTKRSLLAGVLSATLMYWLNDESDSHADSWAFLDRRIDNVLSAGKIMGKGASGLEKAGGRLVSLSKLLPRPFRTRKN